MPLDEHPVAVYLAGLNTADSRRAMRQALDTIADILTNTPDALACDWRLLRFQHVMAVRSHLVEHYAPATVNKYLSALRGVLKAAWLLGQLSAEDYQKAVSVDGVKSHRVPTGREVERDEVARLLLACRQDESITGVRDLAMIAMLYTSGLRRAEVVALDLANYLPEKARLTVRGKGQKERLVWLSAQANTLVQDWIIARQNIPGPLFLPISRGKNVVTRRLSTQAVYYILKKRAEQADVANFSPHDLRRTFVSTLLDKGVDIATVSNMVGHANIQTTARYDRRGEVAKQAAAAQLDLPTATDFSDNLD